MTSLAQRSDPQLPYSGMRRTLQDLVVAMFGLVTSVLTAFILVWVQVHLQVAIYAFSAWFVIPIGAIACGFVAAGGYYIGNRMFNHRPTRLLAINVLTVSVTTFLLLKYLLYRGATFEAQPASLSMSFLQFLDTSIREGALSINFWNLGSVGGFGYVFAVTQILGFAVGGLYAYWDLVNIYRRQLAVEGASPSTVA